MVRAAAGKASVWTPGQRGRGFGPFLAIIESAEARPSFVARRRASGLGAGRLALRRSRLALHAGCREPESLIAQLTHTVEKSCRREPVNCRQSGRLFSSKAGSLVSSPIHGPAEMGVSGYTASRRDSSSKLDTFLVPSCRAFCVTDEERSTYDFGLRRARLVRAVPTN